MIRASAPAKINLVFQVGSLESTGYHPVNSLYLELDLREEIQLQRKSDIAGVNILVQSHTLPSRHVNAVPTDSSNLVYKVAHKLFTNAGIDLSELEVQITKRIPVAGGMAGGSANAAAMLVATNEYLFEEYAVAKLADSELLGLAAEFGSDVPFSMVGGLAIGTGRGEKLVSCEPLRFETHWVLAIANEGLSTPQVFAKFDEISQPNNFTDLSVELGSIEELAKLMTNALEPAAVSLLPTVGQNLQLLEQLGSLKAMVTGSGPTVIGLFESAEKATFAAKTLTEMGLLALTAVPNYLGTRLER